MKIINWLSQYNKAFVPLFMAIIYFVNAHYGVEVPLDEVTVTLVWGAVTSFLTWLIPNTKPVEK